MKTPLKSAVRDLYNEIELSPAELDKIKSDGTALSYATAEHNQANARPSRAVKSKPVWVAAVAACFCILSFFLWQFTMTNYWKINKTDVIIADVIDNHLAHKAMQYQTKSLAELGGYFSYLGFMLATSQPIRSIGLDNLLGARPCLILDIPAAQLRYQLDDNLWATVFQTRYQKSIYGPIPNILDKEQPLVKTNRGVNVSLWREGDLLFAVALPHQ